MKSNSKYNVVKVLEGGKVKADSKVYKTLEGAVRRLQQLVQFEDMQLRAGFGQSHEYRIEKA